MILKGGSDMGDLTMNIYWKHLKTRYKRAGRKDKKRILDEFCETSGLDRKHVIKKLNNPNTGFKHNRLAVLGSIWPKKS